MLSCRVCGYQVAFINRLSLFSCQYLLDVLSSPSWDTQHLVLKIKPFIGVVIMRRSHRGVPQSRLKNPGFPRRSLCTLR